MKISIAMATYNGSKYIEEQLKSLETQSRKPDELIICDDGSTDTTVDLIDNFSKTCSFAVQIYRNPVKLGYAKNFEKALQLCTGDLICLCDQDDYWESHKIATVEAEFKRKPDLLCLLNDQYIAYEDLILTGYTQLDQVHSLGLPPEYFITGCCTTLHKDLLALALPLPDEITAHDTWINKIAYMIGGNTILEQPLQKYRRHNSNTSNDITSKTHRISWINSVTTYGITDCRPAWRRNIRHIELYIQRLQQAKEKLHSPKHISCAIENIANLHHKKKAIVQRIHLASIPRWRRAPYTLKHWLAGTYENFNGWKSALKDMIRP